MSGYTDIDGSTVMAGSPDLAACAEEQLRDVMGEHHFAGALKRIADLRPPICPDPKLAAEMKRRAQYAIAIVSTALNVMRTGSPTWKHTLADCNLPEGHAGDCGILYGRGKVKMIDGSERVIEGKFVEKGKIS